MIGKTLGRYQVTGKIGAGGMGEVYRARDAQLGRDVAIKVLPVATLTDDAARARFRKEALALASVNHANIGSIYDFGTDNGVDFLVMECVEGETLASKLQAGPIPERESIAIAAHVASALEEAHERGVIHRDLKPANILITNKGQPKVLDFGLARLVRPGVDADVTVSLSEPHAVAGTVPYMAPEQLRAQPADARTDVWALGVVLYEMLTGSRPFHGQTGYELSSAILNQSPPVPANVPAWLNAVIDKCLEKDPARRYQRTGEVRAALEALQSGAVASRASRQDGLRRRGLLALAATAALVAVIAGFDVAGLRTRFFGGPAAPSIESLAVLPLTNLSGDAEQEYFVDGMTDELIAQLSKLRPLRVISRTSVMRYKGAPKPIAEIARELQVQAVLEGTVRRAGSRVRVSAQLIGANTDSALWSGSFDRDVRDILLMQSEIASAIADEIRVQLSPQDRSRLASARAVDPEAYELYLRGRYQWNQRSPESLKKGLEYFQQAIAKNPGYAAAWAGVADTYVTLYDYELLLAEESTAQATAAARKALELDANLAEAHASLAHVHLHNWKWQDAKKEFERAIELDPSYTLAHHWYALCLTAIGRVQEATVAMEKAYRLDPLSTRISADLGMAYLAARQPDKAIAQENRTLNFAPESRGAYWIRGMAHEQKGQYPQAIADFQEAVKRAPDNPNFMAALAHAYALAGRQPEARRVLSELKKNPGAQPFFLALVYTGLGEKTAALDALEKAYQDHSGSVRYLKVEPRLDPLRDEPRFQQMLARMNFPD